ncbi:MAG TPA: chemotaxis protein CheB [Pirellulales bacterium]|nr:chemotaxis protein CheB [Pirellulales bacterium]
MSQIDLFVIGGSAGGLSALLELVRELPADLPAALCVAIHTAPSSPGMLPRIVAHKTELPCVYAENNQELTPGRIYFAPVDRHLLISGSRMLVTHGPRENGFRPAVDPLFRSAARSYGPRVAGVILSGSLGDGSYGLAAIKRGGGIAIVQNPEEALVPSMPLSALRGVDVDHVVNAAEMPQLLLELADDPKGGPGMAGGASHEPPPDPARQGTELLQDPPTGKITTLTCPECGGTIWEEEDERQIRFRCHVGHSYNAESMLKYHSQQVESALWTALRVLEEHASLQQRMADRARSQQLAAAAEHFARRSVESREHAELLRSALLLPPVAGSVDDLLDAGEPPI